MYAYVIRKNLLLKSCNNHEPCCMDDSHYTLTIIPNHKNNRNYFRGYRRMNILGGSVHESEIHFRGYNSIFFKK